MIVIKFSCINQRLRRITSGIIPSNAYGKLKFEFDFRTDDWDTAEVKTANFYYNGKNQLIELDENNQCYVPEEALQTSSFRISVFGGDIVTNYIKNPVDKVDGDVYPDNELGQDDLNILDGGAIVSDLTDGPTDDESNPSDKQGIIDYIVKNDIPFYVGLAGEELSEVKYLQLNTSTANYTDKGFYITTNNEGKITNAGYQISFEGNAESIAQTFSMCSVAKIVTAYQYQPTLNQWLDMGFDGVYWVEDGSMTQTINGQQVTYTTYAYNVELMGDAITAPEYWRFEVEVL